MIAPPAMRGRRARYKVRVVGRGFERAAPCLFQAWARVVRYDCGMRRLLGAAVMVGAFLLAPFARADESPPTSPPATWGVTHSMSAPHDESSPVTRAREALARAKVLDETAAANEAAVKELAARLPILRLRAKATRDRAAGAAGDEREILLSQAEELEADVVVSEAEIVERRRFAAERRVLARELRAVAVKIVREPSALPVNCDPPFSFDASGKKIFHIDCFK